MSETILGISAYYHDSAAALLIDGEIVAAAHEERFTRKKHDPSFPTNAAKYVLQEAGINNLDDLSAIAFYDKPFLTFERLLETYHGFAPKGLRSFLSAMPVWIKEKLFMRKMIKEELSNIGSGHSKLLFPEHHLSHAASAFYPSPFEEAAILTVDGVGEWATTTIGHGKGSKITILKELYYPQSLGLLYSTFTAFLGFEVNEGEWKVMGLAPYGKPVYQDKVRKVVKANSDGSFSLDFSYFSYQYSDSTAYSGKFIDLFGPPVPPEQSHLVIK